MRTVTGLIGAGFIGAGYWLSIWYSMRWVVPEMRPKPLGHGEMYGPIMALAIPVYVTSMVLITIGLALIIYPIVRSRLERRLARERGGRDAADARAPSD